MALAEYKRKRDFSKTPEPPPEKAASAKGHSYLIQKHDATRLHYDFRLELDGVLLSWAVTKGPSLNPADKRLAVRTEDHPLSYGTFEGTIPKGQYGGGTVMLWDRGSWEPEGDPHKGLQKGHLQFVLHGERLTGGWDLIRMHGEEKKENWLLIKRKDDAARTGEAAAKFLEKEVTSVTTRRSMDEIAVDAPVTGDTPKPSAALEHLVQKYPDVELATLAEKPPEGNEWVHEVKFDGYRLLGFVVDGQVRLRTRNGNDWTVRFPSIHASIARLKAKSAVLDMEAVVLDNAGKSNFQSMQHALGDGGKPQLIQAYVFDMLYFDGKDLTHETLLDRKKSLQSLLKKSKGESYLHYSDHVVGQGAEMIAKSCDLGLEGIVSKRSDSRYSAGRQTTWLKSKCIKRQEFVIIGYTDARKGSRAIGALHLGYNDKGEMKYAGKVGTGFSMASAKELFDRLAKLKIDKSPVSNIPASLQKTAHWVKPTLLCEVAFTEWTEDGHVRHPSFQGLREDKNPQEVTMEKPVSVKTAAASVARNSAARKSTVDAKSKSDALELLGVRVTHPDRVIFKESGATKGDLAEYYAAVAPWILKEMSRHPISLLRCPDGTNGDCFYQRNPGTGLGPDVKPFLWKHKGKSYEYLYIEKEAGLVELVQMGTIELHPWGASIDRIDYPDRLIFDLDPDDAVPFEAVKLAARDLRQRLKAKGLETFLKCTGGKGLHITAPLAGKDKWEAVKDFCAGVAAEMVQEVPEAYIATMTKAKRKGKIFIDYFRNDYTATAIADFAVRARAGGPVALPLEWKELDKLRSANQFTMSDVLKNLKRYEPDPSRYKSSQTIPK